MLGGLGVVFGLGVTLGTGVVDTPLDCGGREGLLAKVGVGVLCIPFCMGPLFILPLGA